jgi:hypothetical protein
MAAPDEYTGVVTLREAKRMVEKHEDEMSNKINIPN